MGLNASDKSEFIIEFLKNGNGKFFTPSEIGREFANKFYLPKSILIVEPSKHLHKILHELLKKGLIQKSGYKNSLRYGILLEGLGGEIKLSETFKNFYIDHAIIPMDQWINDLSRPILRNCDFKLVQKLIHSYPHLKIYFFKMVEIEGRESITWMVRPKSSKYPKGKFEPV